MGAPGGPAYNCAYDRGLCRRSQCLVEVLVSSMFRPYALTVKYEEKVLMPDCFARPADSCAVTGKPKTVVARTSRRPDQSCSAKFSFFVCKNVYEEDVGFSNVATACPFWRCLRLVDLESYADVWHYDTAIHPRFGPDAWRNHAKFGGHGVAPELGTACHKTARCTSRLHAPRHPVLRRVGVPSSSLVGLPRVH
jgi:hypothetical protein